MPELNDIIVPISPLINNQYPEVYRDEADLLILFTKAYYEYLEQSGKELHQSRNLIQYADPDQAVDSFLTHFKKTYLYSIPDAATVDIAFVVKHIMDLYRSKGSKRALELFFKLVYGTNVDLYIPNEYIFRASDAEYVEPRYIELYDSNETALRAYLGDYITGERSGAKAYVSSIVGTSIAGNLTKILFLEQITGVFVKGELIRDSSSTYRSRLNGSLSGVNITNGGNNYSVGDEILVKSSANTSTEGKIKVTSTVEGTGIPDIKLQVGGSGFSSNNALSNVLISSTILQTNNVSNTFVKAQFTTINQGGIEIEDAGPIVLDATDASGTDAGGILRMEVEEAKHGILLEDYLDQTGFLLLEDINDTTFILLTEESTYDNMGARLVSEDTGDNIVLDRTDSSGTDAANNIMFEDSTIVVEKIKLNGTDSLQTGWNDFILLEQTNADGADAGSFLLSEASEELSVFDGQTRPSNTYQTYEEVYSPKVSITFTSRHDTFATDANNESYVEGINSTGFVVANGHVAFVSNTSATNGSILIYETSGSFSTGVSRLRFASNDVVNADFGEFTNNYITGTFIGFNGNSMGIVDHSHANGNTTVAWPSDIQGFVLGRTSNTYARIVGNRSGNNTVVSINSIGNTVSANVYTDFIGSKNSGNVVFADIVIDGSSSNVTSKGYGFSKSTSANVDSVIDKALTFSSGELLGEIVTFTISSTGNTYTGDPVVKAQNKFIENFNQTDRKISFTDRAGTTLSTTDILRQEIPNDIKELSFSNGDIILDRTDSGGSDIGDNIILDGTDSNRSNEFHNLILEDAVSIGSFQVGEGIVQVVNSTVNNYAQVREANTTFLKLGGLVQKTEGNNVFITNSTYSFTTNTITGLLSDATANAALATTYDATENAIAVGRILGVNNESGTMNVRMFSPGVDFVTSTNDVNPELRLDSIQFNRTDSSGTDAGDLIVLEEGTSNPTSFLKLESVAPSRLQTNNNSKSVHATFVTDKAFRGAYTDTIKTGINTQIDSNVSFGTGIIDSVDITHSGLSFNDGEPLTFKVGSNAQLIDGTAIANGTGIGIPYWRKVNGFLSDEYHLHDNDFYQTFSYQVLSEFELNKYEKLLKEVIHTSGYKLFGKAVIDSFNNTSISAANTSVSQA
jgi:hypothetical protein